MGACVIHLSFLTLCSLCSPGVNSFEASSNQPMHIYMWPELPDKDSCAHNHLRTYVYALSRHAPPVSSLPPLHFMHSHPAVYNTGPVTLKECSGDVGCVPVEVMLSPLLTVPPHAAYTRTQFL